MKKYLQEKRLRVILGAIFALIFRGVAHIFKDFA